MKRNFNRLLVLFSFMFTTLLLCEKEETIVPSVPNPNLKPNWKIANSPNSTVDSTQILSNK